MGKNALTNAYLTVNAVDLSNRLRSLSAPESVDVVDVSSMGDGTHDRRGGLKDHSGSAEFNQDYAAGSVDATLAGLVGSVVAIAWRAVNAAISTTNPERQSNVLITSYEPLAGSVGDADIAKLTWQAAGPITRDVTP